MHAAPSVSYLVLRSGRAGLALALVWLAGAAAVLGWRGAVDHPAVSGGMAQALVAACGLFVALAWLRSGVGSVRWDGLQWWWCAARDPAPGRLSVALDCQRYLLLRWLGEDGGKVWLWVERRTDPQCWEALRRAIYSAAPPAVPASPSRS